MSFRIRGRLPISESLQVEHRPNLLLADEILSLLTKPTSSDGQTSV